MAKPKPHKRSEEGQMRDRMNGIVRDSEGNIVSRYGVPVKKPETETAK